MTRESIDEAVTFRTGSACSSSGCVGVAFTAGQILIKDTKYPSGAVLTFDTDEWQAFVSGIKAGEFDHP